MSGASTASPGTSATVEEKHGTKRKALDFDDWGSVTVTLKVRDESGTKVFIVHKALACHHSPVLNAAFNSEFKEGQTLSMSLHETTKAAAGSLVRWMYKESLCDREGNLARPSVLISLWMLADRLLIPELQNAAIMAIDERRKQDHTIEISHIKRVYESTALDSPLRRLLVDQIVMNLAFADFERDLSATECPYTFEIVKDIALALKKRPYRQRYVRNMAHFLVPVLEEATQT